MSQAYLGDVLASYQPQPAPAPSGPPKPWVPQDPLGGPGVMGGYDPLKDPDPNGTINGPPPPPPSPNASVNGPPAPAPGTFPLHLASRGGVTPAHELETRGPTFRRQQEAANEATYGAIERNTENSQRAAQQEYAMALEQERLAQAREQGWQQAVAERDNELQQRQDDFDQSVKALSQTSVDPDRFWSTRSTGQKIAAMISLAAGGFLQGARGGSNPGLDAINSAIDRDIHAQELTYHIARDTVGARQTAFGMAMDKYRNADAARAMARAAALDTVQAQMAQNAALWKGTDAVNRANAAIAQLEQEKAGQISQGLKFILPQASGPTFVDENGITYNMNQARELSKELRGYEQEHQKMALGTAGKIFEEQAKEQGYGGLGKEGQQKLAFKEAEAQRELTANLAAIDKAKSNVQDIISGSTIGAATSGLPAWVPGVTTGRKNEGIREAYNRRVLIAVAAGYRLGTDAAEPKNRAMVEHTAQPFIISPRDNEETALQKMDLLRNFLGESAAAKGAEMPKLSPEAAASFKGYGK